MAPIGYRVLHEEGVTFPDSPDPVELFSIIAGGARLLKAEAPSSLSEVRGQPERSGAPLPAVSMAAELFTAITCACLFTAFPTICQSRFLTSHLKLDPDFET